MILKQLSLSLENISFIYYTYKMSNNNLPNTWNSKKDIERIITAARDYEKWHMNKEDLRDILNEHSVNPPEWTKQNTLNNNGNNNEPHQKD